MRGPGWLIAGMLTMSWAAGCGKEPEPEPRPARGGQHAPAPARQEPEASRPAPAPAPAAPKPTAPAPAPSGGSRAVRPPAAPPPAAGTPSEEEPAPTPTPGTQKGRQPSPAPSGIVQINDHKWTVERALAESWMDNPYALGNARESGEGWQLMGVKTRAAYHLGMRNGDIVLEANGHKLNTKAQLLAAYLDLKNDTVFNVTFLRNGTRMVHTYQIVN